MGLGLSKIYSCEGKHFKVYNSELQEVLEHPNDEEPVSISFRCNERNLKITATDFIKRRMREEGQKNRGDIYILQKQFRPLLAHLEDLLEKLEIRSNPERPWRFGSPQARGGRQGVPRLKKLAEVSGVSLIAPFNNHVFRIKSGYLMVDSEIPGIDQKKWDIEGGERQIHLGAFGSNQSLKKEKMAKKVIVKVPLEELEHNFLKPIQTNWID